MFDLITTAYAESGTSTTAGGGMSSILMIVVMLAIFYFLLIRPENKRKKQAEEMRSSLKKGDWLTTIGGVYGRVVSITDRTVARSVRWTSRLPPCSAAARRPRRKRLPPRWKHPRPKNPSRRLLPRKRLRNNWHHATQKRRSPKERLFLRAEPKSHNAPPCRIQFQKKA